MKNFKHFQSKYLNYKLKEQIKYPKLEAHLHVGPDQVMFLILLINQVKKNSNSSFIKILSSQKELKMKVKSLMIMIFRTIQTIKTVLKKIKMSIIKIRLIVICILNNKNFLINLIKK